MNFSRRLLCLLCSFILLSCVFSTVVSAEKLELKPYNVTMVQSLSGAENMWLGSATFQPNNNVEEYQGQVENTITVWGTSYLTTIYQISNTDNSIMIPSERRATIKFTNVYHSAFYDFTGQYLRVPQELRVLIHYKNGEYEYVDEVEYSQHQGTPMLDMSFTFVPKYDVKTIEFQVKIEEWFDAPTKIISYLGEANGDSGFILEVEQQSEESGLLSGLIEWVKSIFDKIGDIFESIKELPSKIWQFISDGLKSLFIPSEDFIVAFKDDITIVMADKLGAVYQVIDITSSSWERIQANDEQNEIEIPLVTIPLPEGNEFSFGGVTVPIVPEGFEFLATALKMIVGALFTSYFINGLKRRYDEILGGS